MICLDNLVQNSTNRQQVFSINIFIKFCTYSRIQIVYIGPNSEYQVDKVIFGIMMLHKVSNSNKYLQVPYLIVANHLHARLKGNNPD